MPKSKQAQTEMRVPAPPPSTPAPSSTASQDKRERQGGYELVQAPDGRWEVRCHGVLFMWTRDEAAARKYLETISR
jgi:hypothetical protein